MKFRLGAITGTPVAGEGAESAGIYFARTESRDDLTQLRAVYYKGVKIWPGEGMYRITALKLQIDDENAKLLQKYAGASNDFMSGEAYLKVQIGKRTYSRTATQAQIQWDSGSKTLLFLNNNGPFADAVTRGEYLTLEFGMQGYQEVWQPNGNLTSLTCVKPYAEPVTTCTIYLGAQWHNRDAGAAAICDLEGNIKGAAEAYYYTGKKKKGGGGSRYVGQEKTYRGISYPFSIWLKGYSDARKAVITYPAASGSVECMVTDIEVME